jgi:hypothetical protein
MFLILQIVSVFLVSVAMSLSLAHALELPGKLRLDKETYCAVQTIYYPGFTFGGLSEGIGIIAVLALVLMTPTKSAAFWWTLIGFVALIAMHAAYWIITHPVNKFWLKDQDLKGASAGFFGFDPFKRQGRGERDGEEAWQQLRDRWEHSHVLRAVLSAFALIALTVANCDLGGEERERNRNSLFFGVDITGADDGAPPARGRVSRWISSPTSRIQC